MKYRLRTINAALAVILLFSALGFMPRTVEAVSDTIRISQVYGGGGNTDATYTNDFIELFNAGNIAVDISGWSVQYASATGTSWSVTNITSGTISPGGYFLIQEAAGTGGTTPLPTPDATGTIAMSSSQGKVALVNNQTKLPAVTCPVDASIVDFVGFGSANCFEGSAPTPALNNTTAALRKAGGCTDTDDNAADFETGAPTPRNSSSSTNICNPVVYADDLFISEYIEGSSSNKALEIYNGTGAPVDLRGYKVVLYANGTTTPENTLTWLEETIIADGDVYVIANSAANATILGVADITSTVTYYNGDDAIALQRASDDSYVDVIGQIGNDPGSAWGTEPTTTVEHTLVRKINICSGDVIADDPFDPATEWDSYPQDTLTYLGAHTAVCPLPPADEAPSVASTVPANGAAGVAVDADIVVTFSEAVTVDTGWYNITCATSGAHTAAVTDADPVYTLNPDIDFAAAESCTVTIYADKVSDIDDIDPLNMAANHVFTFTTTYCGQTYTKINEIQGSDLTSPFVGQTKTVEGVVTAYLPGMDGSYLESVPNDKDADETTSEGIFVYKLNATPGDIVRVTGSVSEYTGSYGNTALMTQLGSISNVEVCGGIGTAPTPITLPIPSDADPNAYLERYEGMLVSFEQPLTIQQNYYQGRFGQLTLGVDGRIMNPTNGTGGDYIGNIRRMVILDDGSTVQNPNPISYYPLDGALRAGDVVTELVGVMDQGRITSARSYVTEELVFPDVYYRIHPVVPPALEIHNPRPIDSPDIKGEVKIVSFNVLNYFTTLDILPYPAESPYDVDLGITPRGADSATEFTRQQDKLVAAALDIDADILGLNEIEAWDGANAVEAFTDALNTEIGDTVYAYIPDPAGGVGGDAIQQAIIYKPASVSPVGAALSLSATPFDLYRYPIAQLFADNASGEQFWVVVNHFKSKNCGDLMDPGDEDLGGGIGCYNATRVAMSEALLTWIDTTLSVLDPDVIITGDLNSYGGEDPIMTLTDAGMVDQVAQHLDPLDRYTYVFDGMAGYLDHAITTPSLAEYVADAAIWHINADELSVIDYNLEFKNPDLYQSHEFRSSDHDPVIITLRFSEFIYYFPLIFN